MVLQAVYDASPLVRAEVAVGLARLAESHSVLFQVHILRVLASDVCISCVQSAEHLQQVSDKALFPGVILKAIDIY